MRIPRCGGLLQSGFLISGTWIPEIPIVCETPDSLGCIQRPKPRIPDYLTSDKIVIYVLSWSGSPSSQIKLSQKLLWPIHTQFPAALFAPVKGLAGRGSRGGGSFYMKCLKCSSSFWEIGHKLLFTIFSNEYMQGKPAVDMLHATIFWKLSKMEGNAVKNLWQLRPSGDTFGDKFRPKMYLTMNLNKCKSQGKNRFITVAFSSPWVHSATHLHKLRWNAS